MRCKYCGHTSLHADKQHRTFSTGKAVAGAVVFGPSGAVAGMIGKDLNGYRCGACGAFMDAPMDLMTEQSIDNAIANAEAGRGISTFQYYQKQYPNIYAAIPERAASKVGQVALPVKSDSTQEDNTSTVKRAYQNLLWVKDCPVYVEKVIIHTTDTSDTLSFVAWNQCASTIRSAYFQVTVFDDTGDQIVECRCVYQGLSIAPGKMFPVEKEFPLKTDLAYRVSFVCEKVALEDDSVWRFDSFQKQITLSDQVELKSMSFPRLKYVRQHLSEASTLAEDENLFLPWESDGYWQCICGQPVAEGGLCSRCGASIEKLNHLLSQEYLRELQQNAVKQIAAKRATASMHVYKSAVEQEFFFKYQQASGLQKQNTEQSLVQAKNIYQSILNYKDAAQQAESCQMQVLELKYRKACELKAQDNEESLAQAIAIYKTIPDYCSSDQMEKECQIRISEIHEEAERRKVEQEKQAQERLAVSIKRKNKIKKAVSFSLVTIAIVVAVVKVIIPESLYRIAENHLENGNYEKAKTILKNLGGYKSAAERAEMLYQSIALDAISLGKITSSDDEKTKSLLLWNVVAVRDTISSFINHNVALRTDGIVIATGRNNEDQCDVEDWNNIVAVSAGRLHTVGLREDGTVVATGDKMRQQCQVSDWKDIVAISAGEFHTVGLRMDGTVLAVGVNNNGQCDVSGWEDIIAISAGYTYTAGLKVDGTVVVTDRRNSQNDVSTWSGITAISVGYAHTVGLKSDGTVIATGWNQYGQCDVSGWSDVIAVSAGYDHTVGLKSDGTVVAVGENDYGQCDTSDWSDIVAISAGKNYTLGLQLDGTIVAVGNNNGGEYSFSEWKDIKVPKN